MPATVAYQRETRAAGAQHIHAGFAPARTITRPEIFPTPLVQAKLRIGRPNDRFEQEADRVAGEVMRTGKSGIHVAPAPGVSPAPFCLQEKCASRSSGGGLCPECAEEEKLRRQPEGGVVGISGEFERSGKNGSNVQAAANAMPAAALPHVYEVLGSPARPLDLSTRSLMESRFQHDFSRVRLHADRRAEESVHELHALAYTVGRDVIIGAGQYSPSNESGKKLLAHELVHVVQQGGVPIRSQTMLPVGTPGNALERKAEAAAQGQAKSVSPVSRALYGPSIQRAVKQQGEGTIRQPKPKDQQCAGWFADHESSSKRAAEHYVRTELTGNRGKGEKIVCDLFFPSTGVFGCTVHFTDGTRIRVLVRKDAIIVGVYPIKSLRPPPDQPLCWYDYSCPGPLQDLILTRRKCQTAKTAAGTSKGRGPQP